MCINLLGVNAGFCDLCLTPCLDCLGSDYTKCTTCVTGYALNVDVCDPCITNCIDCSDLVTCDVCNTTYYLDYTSLVCVHCPLICTTCAFNATYNAI